MTFDEKILQEVQKLPASFQEELLDFIQYLLMKSERREMRDWSYLSLSYALEGMDNEERIYDLSDLRVVFE